MGLKGWFCVCESERERASDDHMAEISEIVDEVPERADAVLRAVVPGGDEVPLAALLSQGRSAAVQLGGCEAGELADGEDGSVVVVRETVALEATGWSV